MRDLLTSLRLVILTVLVCCVVYPAVLLTFGQTVVPWMADGSIITDARGRIVGSALIAQQFTGPGYFWPRPSAVDYDGSAAGGSNLSPANPALAERARKVIAHYDIEGGQRIPADLVSASGSGLDPHITIEAARFQLARVAVTRGLPQNEVDTLIEHNREEPMFRVLGGEPVVNVLMLNLALDKLTGAQR